MPRTKQITGEIGAIKHVAHPRQAITVKHIGPTDADPNPRWSARSYAGRLTVYNDDAIDETSNAARAAIALCKRYGWDHRDLVAGRLASGDYVYVFSDPPARSASPGSPSPASGARVKCTDALGNVAFIHYSYERWCCTLANGTPAAFSYAGIPHNQEMEIRFALSECATADEVLATVKRFSSRHNVELV